MKHIFILNPAAGKGKAEAKYLPQIHKAAKELNVEYEIHRTLNIGEGENYTRQRCVKAENEKEIYRFYACGGDGTLNEVVNGAAGYKNVEIAFIPSGTGNDFARNFQVKKEFSNVKSQILGKSKPIDLLKYSKDSEEERFCINMINIGFDCNAAMKMEELRKYPFIAGTSAYVAGVGLAIIKKKGIKLSIGIEKGNENDHLILMMSLGNGKFSGGGFKGLPEASVDDGLMDIGIIKDITRRKMLGMIGDYKKGVLLQTKRGRVIMDYQKATEITIKSKEPFCIAVDGETTSVSTLSVQVDKRSILFSIPQ